MKQTIYFAEVPQEFEVEGDYFEFEGRYFYFQLEVDFSIQHVKLVDTVGRYFPIDFDNLVPAILAMDRAADLVEAAEDFAIVEVR